MVNYGYDATCRLWNESKKNYLAFALGALLKELNYNYEANGRDPYIEIDGPYQGVRIRKITHLSEQQEADLKKRADQIYLEIMTNQPYKIGHQDKADVPASVVLIRLRP